MEELMAKIVKWAEDRDLLNPENSNAQLLKVGEEVGGLMAAHIRRNRELVIDGIGDILVTLIIYARQRDIDVVKALQSAYDEIKDRKGKVVNGNFIKDEEYNPPEKIRKIINRCFKGEEMAYKLYLIDTFMERLIEVGVNEPYDLPLSEIHNLIIKTEPQYEEVVIELLDSVSCFDE